MAERVRAGFLAAAAVVLVVVVAIGYVVTRPSLPPPPPAAAWSARPLVAANLPTGGLVHGCLLTEAGTAFCWGGNSYAQLGEGTNRSSLLPKAVRADSFLTAVDAGDSHTCAVTREGSVLCWGLNPRGQAGTSRDATCIVGGLSYACNPTPQAVRGVPALRAVGAGADHSCGLARDGHVWCWGSNDRGQLGRGRDPGSFAPVEVGGGIRFAALSVGQFHSCGVTTAGAVLCWGWNLYGQLGSAARAERCGPNPWSPTPCLRQPVRAEARVRFTAVAAGSKHTCALAADSTAYCWGGNRLGQLGTGDTVHAMMPKPVAGARRFSALTAGTDFSCAVASDGAAWCWGDNALGQLGGTDRASSATPMRVRVEGRFASVGAGAGHACGILESGAAVCWGAGTAGQLGNGFRSDRREPVTVQGDAAQRQRAP